MPNTRAGRISILRVFFRDLQEWDLIPGGYSRSGGNNGQCLFLED
jgi:hypothetical protein